MSYHINVNIISVTESVKHNDVLKSCSNDVVPIPFFTRWSLNFMEVDGTRSILGILPEWNPAPEYLDKSYFETNEITSPGAYEK
jgi:hypothetical protein